MKRRTFLQGIGAALVAVAAQPIFAWGGFDPQKQYGNWIVLHNDWDSIGKAGREKVMSILMTAARKTLPSGTPTFSMMSPCFPKSGRSQLRWISRAASGCV